MLTRKTRPERQWSATECSRPKSEVTWVNVVASRCNTPFIGYATSRAGKRVSSKGGEVRCSRDFDSRRPPDRSPGAFFLSRGEPGSYSRGSGIFVVHDM